MRYRLTERLLLICAQKELNDGLKEEACDLIKKGVRWERFAESAMKSGVTILVYNTLKAIAPYAPIPQFVFDRLKSTYLFVAAESVHQHHKKLMEVLRLFAKKDIPFLPMKGTLLAKRLYGDIAARGLSSDFDFLIREKDKEKAQILLEEVGYSRIPDRMIKQWQWQWLWCHTFLKAKATPIDLHWDVTRVGRSKERIEGFWKGARMAVEEGISFYEFNEEELLLYLCSHVVKRASFRYLKNICDINGFLHRYKGALDWNDIIEKSKRWKLSNSLYLSLKLSKDLFNSDVPPEVLNKLRPDFLKLILIKILASKKAIFRNGFWRRLVEGDLSYIFFELIEARSVRDYSAIFKRAFFPPGEVLGNRSYASRSFKGIFKVIKKVVGVK